MGVMMEWLVGRGWNLLCKYSLDIWMGGTIVFIVNETFEGCDLHQAI
jgi:hypothetical protein